MPVYDQEPAKAHEIYGDEPFSLSGFSLQQLQDGLIAAICDMRDEEELERLGGSRDSLTWEELGALWQETLQSVSPGDH